MSIRSPYDTSDFRPCITHHHACDCREARVARLVEALEEVASFQPCEPWRDITRAVVVARAALDEWRKP